MSPAVEGGTWLARLGDTDCEAFVDGVLAQPVNSLSSLAFLAVGGALVWWALRQPRGRRLLVAVYGGAVAANGIGGLLYHGPAWPGSTWVHDVALVAPLVFIVLYDVGTVRPMSSVQLLGAYGVIMAPGRHADRRAASVRLGRERGVRRARPRHRADGRRAPLRLPQGPAGLCRDDRRARRRRGLQHPRPHRRPALHRGLALPGPCRLARVHRRGPRGVGRRRLHGPPHPAGPCRWWPPTTADRPGERWATSRRQDAANPPIGWFRSSCRRRRQDACAAFAALATRLAARPVGPMLRPSRSASSTPLSNRTR